MKRAIAILISAVLAFSALFALAACGRNSPATPSDVTKSTLEALKKKDLKTLESNCAVEPSEMFGEQLGSLIVGNSDSAMETFAGLDSGQKLFVLELLNKITDFDYELGKETVDGDTATVEVTFSTYDFPKYVQAVVAEYAGNEVGKLLGGKGTQGSSATEKYLNLMQENFDMLSEKTITSTAVIELQKVQDSWKVSPLPDTVMDSITGNMTGLIEKFVATL